MNLGTIAVIGLGYIGLPTAAVLASRKIKVVGIDVNLQAVEAINRGEVHIVEPDLDMLVHAAVTEGYLRATSAVEPADAFLIAVPTPFNEKHEPDLSFIKAASKSIAPMLKKGNLVVLESTSPVGATEQMATWLADARPDLSFPQDAGEASDIRIAHCPERVLPGRVLRELVHNDRVIGGITARCSEVAASLYKIFVEAECVITDARTAEMCKLTENSFRDVNIAFANELSVICDRLGVNVWELIRLANRHPRVDILKPGPGVGGHCVAVDPWFIVNQAPEQSSLIRTAREVNDGKPAWVINKAQSLVDEISSITGKKRESIQIACLGLAFKADIDDLRESPALAITLELAKLFPGQLVAVEPNIALAPDILFEAEVPLIELTAAMEADILLLLVDHKTFSPQLFNLRQEQRLLDTRGVFA